jgi:hypothetical protein
MARTLQFSGTFTWPLEDGQQAAKKVLTVALNYAAALAIEKPFAAPVIDEALALPVASVKTLFLEAKDGDITVKLNGSTQAVTLKAGKGFLLYQNDDGGITDVTVTVAAVPATLKGMAFA